MSTPTAEEQAASGSRHRAVAPTWHTVLVLLALFGLSVVGARTGNLVGGRYGRAGGYVSVIVFEWILVAFIWYGTRSRGVSMSDLVGGRWRRWNEVLRDLGIAVGFLVIGSITLQGMAFLLKTKPNQAFRNMLPQSGTEIILWLALSLTAGICEEILCRGYLLRQFSALTQSALGGVLLQGVAFGAGHGYQGWKMMLAIALYGIIFGLLAQWRQSLRPGMMAHFMQDGVGGLLARHFVR